MQHKIINKVVVLVLMAIIGLSACSKFMDVNNNPNNPSSATPVQILPSAEAAIGDIVGNGFQVFGNFWSQFWTQSPQASQYQSIDKYTQVNSNFNYPWLFIYRDALINLQLIINNSNEHQTQYAAIAYILKAYTYQMTTDAFGDIPLSEALTGTGNPKYDSQQNIYDSIFAYVEKGKSMLNVNSAEAPGSEDIIFQGNLSNWLAFANTLELRAYLRLSQVDPTMSEKGVKMLYSSNAKFLTGNAEINYSTIGGNQNPLYINQIGLGGTQNYVASNTVVSAFLKNKDPRLYVLYNPVKDSGTAILPLAQGNFSGNNTNAYSTPSALVAGDAQSTQSALAPVRLISSAESYFLQAEASYRGWGNGITTDSLFRQGIRASFANDNIPDSAANYIQNAPDAQISTMDTTGQLKLIITQKYYSMCGSQGFEAWTEWRRTGFPNFFITSIAANGAPFPLRFLYPTSELTSNSNYPGTVSETTPVWWDKVKHN